MNRLSEITTHVYRGITGWTVESTKAADTKINAADWSKCSSGREGSLVGENPVRKGEGPIRFLRRSQLLGRARPGGGTADMDSPENPILQQCARWQKRM